MLVNTDLSFGLSRVRRIAGFPHEGIVSWPIIPFREMLLASLVNSRCVASMNSGAESHSIRPSDRRTMRIREIYELFARNRVRRPDDACGCVEITSNLPVSSSAEQTLFFVDFANLITIGYLFRDRASAFTSILFELSGKCVLS